MRFQVIIITLLLSALAFQKLGQVSRCLKKEVIALKTGNQGADNTGTDYDFSANASSCKTSFNYIVLSVDSNPEKPIINSRYDKPSNTVLKQSNFSFNIYSPPRFTDHS
ncbi:MAG: hypothetical protein ACXWV5_08765 [Flavitalea sp.]